MSDTERIHVGQRTVGPARGPAEVSSVRVGRLVVASMLLVIGPLVYTLTGADVRHVIELHPSNADASCKEEFIAVARSLQPGDELVLHGGTYTQGCQRRIRGLHGTPDRPIIIRAAAGETPVLTRPRQSSGGYSQNNLEIEDSTHLIIRGLRLKGGSTGLRFMGATAHITVEDTEIYETDNNALSMNSGDTHSFVIRRNHIHHTGLLPDALGETEGEGLYVGCHDGRCVGSNHLIENNYIHHLRGTSDGGNDGIEVKRGSHGVVIRNNVIHHTNIGTRYPCIFVYGGGPQPNIVEGNAVWQCGEAIQVVADAIVRNNVILDSDVGITSAPHRQVPKMQRVSIVNNTLHGHQECLNIRWQHARDMVLANNAVYCPGGRAVDALGLEEPSVRARANLVEGGLIGVALDGVRFLPGGRAQDVFRQPRAADFFPRSGTPLIGSAIADWAPEDDFNGEKRVQPYDVGAYQRGGHTTNPGWRIVPGFKDR